METSDKPLPRRRPSTCTTWPGSRLSRVKWAALSYSILIVDDSTLVCHLIRSYIEPHAAWRVCGEAENGKAAIEKVKELRPDIVILDFQMPVMNGLEAARQIAILAPNTAMLMLTMHNFEQLSEEAHAAGIKAVLSKSEGVADRLIAALRNVVPKAGI